MTNARPEFTLIVPTFNRPQDFARLLNCLARQKAAFPVLVLDSSDGAAKAANAALVDTLDLDVRLLAFDSSISPFEKFWRGSEEVQTEFCALCADDDVVLVEAIPPLVHFLEQHPDFSAAHGFYFGFFHGDCIAIHSIVYSGASVDRDDPLARLVDFFRRYEAVTYALYRSEVMRNALRRIQPLRSMLAHELLAGALTVVAGKVARLPIGYYGRSLSPSLPYQHWHPIDFLVSSPQALFDDYVRYRLILVDSLKEPAGVTKTTADLLKILDLVHLRYFADYVSPAMMDYLLEHAVVNTPPAEVMSGVWPQLDGRQPALRRLWSSELLTRLRRRLAHRVPLHRLRWRLGGASNRTVKATTFAGRPREYRLYAAFLSALRATPVDSAVLIDGIVRGMNAYE